MKDLHMLPKFRDSLSYLYLEHCKIEQEDKAIAFYTAEGKTPVPCAALSLLLLGPGTSITHAAIKNLSDNGCLIIWSGEQSVRFYAQGMGENRSSANLSRQAKLHSIPALRLNVVRRLYQLRFPEPLPNDLTLQQIRGREGIRVREAYARASRESGVEWKGRNYDTKNWGNSDPVNRALSCANSALYGICHAGIVSLGYSTGLGFIHSGKQLSFVYDIADLYKTEISIPVAFTIAALNPQNLEKDVRIACREAFQQTRLLPRIAKDLEKLFDFPELSHPSDLNDDINAENAGYLWNPVGCFNEGGINYGEG